MLPTYITLGVLCVIVAFAGWRMWKAARSGECGCGCAGCGKKCPKQ